MRLISLTANKPTFHPVEFREFGPTLIVGAQKDAAAKNADRTYNGVGKSLIVSLLHFCLGSDKNAEFESKLPDWQFVLHFEHRGKDYRVSRTTTDQSKLNFNGEEVGVKAFRRAMEELVFSLPQPIPNLTFRSLIPYFVRPRKESYIAFDQTDGDSKPYARLLRVAFLLGLDIDLVVKKAELRTEQERIRTLRTNLNSDTVFIEFFTDNKDPDIELLDLEKKIEEKRANLRDFNIAEDYHDKQREANSATQRVQKLRNHLVVVRDAIANIEKSLAVAPDITPEMIVRVFDEAKAALPDRVTKRIEDVAEFHKRLLDNRIRRLSHEKMILEREFDSVEKQIASASSEADALRRFLGTHGALDEFVALSEALNELEAKAQKLRDYQALIEEYSNKIQELTAELSKETIRATRYLKDAKTVLDSNMERFRSLSSRFYGEKPGGLSIKNNEGENQTRFDIDVRIESDASDGINEVKMFCFDMTVLTQRHNHAIDFVFHDSRMFSDVDARQRATIFKVAHEITTKESLQYIATLNEDQIASMRDQFSDDEFKACIDDAIVLKLTDDSASSKLLGIQVDIRPPE